MSMKRIVSVVLAGVMLLVLMAGCTSGGKGTASESTTAKGTTAATTQTQEETLPGNMISKDPITLSFHMVGYKKDLPVFQKAAEMTNIFLEPTLPETVTDSKEAYNIMIASNELADVVQNGKQNFFKDGPEGAFIPLNDLIDQYAPNIKKYMEANPDARKHWTAPDGNIYFISRIESGEFAKGWFIRTDWLEKLNLEMPKTIDEYYNVLKAFLERDPNGNGKQDEVPLFDRALDDGLADKAVLWGAHAGYLRWYEKDGIVRLGEYEEAFKLAMKGLAQWYKEKLIDQEIFTRGGKARDILFGNNTGGSTHDWFAGTAAYNDKDFVKAACPDFKLEVMPPPADINGVVTEYWSRSILHNSGWAISAVNKNPIETIKYFDFWFSEVGVRLYNFGIEGLHYDMVNGEEIIKPEMLKDARGFLAIIQEAGGVGYIGALLDFDSEKQWTNEIASKGIEMYMKNKWPEKVFPSPNFNADEKKVYDEKWAAIETYIKEQTQKWVLGVDNVDETWNKYIETLEKMGVKEVIAAYQSQWERNYK